jgi:Fe-Mn family superoxide dismutase
MASSTSRRDFLRQSGKAGLGVYVGLSGSALLTACTAAKKSAGASVSHQYDPGFQQRPLPYAYNALEQAIDAQTMEIHYTKHAAAYATNLQDAAKAEGVDVTKPLEDTLRNISKYSAKLRNNGGGHYNHELFWKVMAPNGGNAPTGTLVAAITSAFGSFDAFKTKFEEAGTKRFGSGWAWLYADENKKLAIGSTPNQDNPLMDVAEFKGTPILGIDVWEHAYYLKYQNKRADYLAAFWNVVNWDYVWLRYATYFNVPV